MSAEGTISSELVATESSRDLSKVYLAIWVTLVLLTIAWMNFSSSEDYGSGESLGSISKPKGNILVRRSGSFTWKKLHADDPIFNFDSISTNESSSTYLKMNDGTLIFVPRDTQLKVQKQQNASLDLYLTKGVISLERPSLTQQSGGSSPSKKARQEKQTDSETTNSQLAQSGINQAQKTEDQETGSIESPSAANSNSGGLALKLITPTLELDLSSLTGVVQVTETAKISTNKPEQIKVVGLAGSTQLAQRAAIQAAAEAAVRANMAASSTSAVRSASGAASSALNPALNLFSQTLDELQVETLKEDLHVNNMAQKVQVAAKEVADKAHRIAEIVRAREAEAELAAAKAEREAEKVAKLVAEENARKQAEAAKIAADLAGKTAAKNAAKSALVESTKLAEASPVETAKPIAIAPGEQAVADKRTPISPATTPLPPKGLTAEEKAAKAAKLKEALEAADLKQRPPLVQWTTQQLTFWRLDPLIVGNSSPIPLDFNTAPVANERWIPFVRVTNKQTKESLELDIKPSLDRFNLDLAKVRSIINLSTDRPIELQLHFGWNHISKSKKLEQLNPEGLDLRLLSPPANRVTRITFDGWNAVHDDQQWFQDRPAKEETVVLYVSNIEQWRELGSFFKGARGFRIEPNSPPPPAGVIFVRDGVIIGLSNKATDEVVNGLSRALPFHLIYVGEMNAFLGASNKVNLISLLGKSQDIYYQHRGAWIRIDPDLISTSPEAIPMLQKITPFYFKKPVIIKYIRKDK